MQTFAFVNIGTGYELIFTKENNVSIYLDQGTEIKEKLSSLGETGYCLTVWNVSFILVTVILYTVY